MRNVFASPLETSPNLVPQMTRRRTPQQEQELLSRRQLAIAWGDWVVQGSTEDLGEDFLFQIYENGTFSGLSFFLQLKSTKDLARHTKASYVSYPFAVKDLEHWEQSERELGPLFAVQSKGDLLRVRTPFWYPDGGVVDLFVKVNQDVATITDLGEALGWLRMQTLAARRSPKQQKLETDVCTTMGVELFKGQLLTRVL